MNLHIETAGQGEDIVLIHGWGMHGGVWSGVRDRLAQDFRVHVVDLPGMGWSKPVAPYDLRHLADALIAELPEAVAVLGWSMGGQVALRLALDHPQQVRKLVLIASTPRFVNGSDWQSGVAAEVFSQFAAQVDVDYHDTMTRFLALQAFGGESSRSLMRELRECFFARPMPDGTVLQDALRILLETDLRAELPGLSQSLLLIHGNRDTLAPVEASRWMAAQLPHAQLRVIEGASHAPFLSHPTTFIAATRAFLKDLASTEAVA